jgi:putative hydrolase of the HAD superfamily
LEQLEKAIKIALLFTTMTLTENEKVERGMFTSIKLALFDVGGVLFRFKDGLKALSLKTGLPYDRCHEIWLANDDSICRGKMQPQELWEQIKRESRYTGEDIDFAAFWVENFKPNLQVHKLIQAISKNHAVGLLTNIYPEVYQKALSSGNIPSLPYAFVLQSCDTGFVKPEKEIYKLAQQMCGHEAKEILFIDDKQSFIDPAKALGWNTFLFDAGNPDYSTSILNYGFAL